MLAARSDENRRAITTANAITPLVRLLGDGRGVRSKTPQERAAAVLADLARFGDNKKTIVEAGGVKPLVVMLSSDSPEAQTHASGALWHLAALGSNRAVIAEAGAIPLLVGLLGTQGTDGAEERAASAALLARRQKFTTGALWHLASSADNKVQMASAGAVPLLVGVLASKQAEAREHAAGVMSALARSQGGNKKQVFVQGGIPPLIELLKDPKPMTQRHAACALWGLCDGKDGVYDKHIADGGAIPSLIAMLNNDDDETRGFAAACLLCVCRDKAAHDAMVEAGAIELLQAYSTGPATWLRDRVVEMLKLLGAKVPTSNGGPLFSGIPLPVGEAASKAGDGGMVSPAITRRGTETPTTVLAMSPGRGSQRTGRLAPAMGAPAQQGPQTYAVRTQFHVFSFQSQRTTGDITARERAKRGERMW